MWRWLPLPCKLRPLHKPFLSPIQFAQRPCSHRRHGFRAKLWLAPSELTGPSHYTAFTAWLYINQVREDAGSHGIASTCTFSVTVLFDSLICREVLRDVVQPHHPAAVLTVLSQQASVHSCHLGGTTRRSSHHPPPNTTPPRDIGLVCVAGVRACCAPSRGHVPCRRGCLPRRPRRTSSGRAASPRCPCVGVVCFLGSRARAFAAVAGLAAHRAP